MPNPDRMPSRSLARAIQREAISTKRIEAICAELAVDRETIEDVVEPHLLQVDLIKRSHRARIATAEAVAYARNGVDAGRAEPTFALTTKQ